MKGLVLKRRLIYPGIAVDDFRQVVHKTIKVIESVDRGYFPSPFSVVPIISQLIGLESPMMGTGRSPYSLMSIISLLNHEDTFEHEFRYPLERKRMIVDEIYDMLVPLLLGETDCYIDLLMTTKYKGLVAQSGREEQREIRNIINEKFAILDKLSRMLLNDTGDFAHIAHYGYSEDLYRELPFLKDFDEETAARWAKDSFPRVIELEINGFASGKEKVTGWFIFVPNSTEELLQNEGLRKKKLLQAAELAKTLGAKIIGMAGLTASFSRGGHFLSKRVSEVGFTTGHAYTIGNILAITKEITREAGLNITDCTIAIVGAAGSIGSGTARLLSEEGVRHFIFVEREGLVTMRKLELLEESLRQSVPDVEIIRTTEVSEIKTAHIVIMATSAPQSIAGADNFIEGAIIIDDSFPKNVPLKLLDERNDILLLEGGITQLPKSLDINMSRNVPDFLDVPIIKFISTKETYGCFAETLVLAVSGHEKNYGLGDADTALSRDIMEKSSHLGFTLAPFQCYGLPVDDERMKKVTHAIRNRTSLSS